MARSFCNKTGNLATTAPLHVSTVIELNEEVLKGMSAF
jgi:hypothetical protein